MTTSFHDRAVPDQPREDASSCPLAQWQTVVWDDVVNLNDYVLEVLIRHFGYSRHAADELTAQIHTFGRAVVSTGIRERMEADVLAMHGYGLHATLEQLT